MTFRPSKTSWRVAGLLALCVVPIVAGVVRFHEVTTGALLTEENARFLRDPIPVLIHVVAVSVYAILGAFQFVPSLRRKKSSWHRRAGLVLAPAGLVVALGGLWMTATYPRPPGDGHLVTFFRVVFGAGMVTSLVLGVLAVRRRDFALHGAWMTRAYAIGMGAGTQVLTHIPYFLWVDAPNELGRGLCMGAGWIINLGIAEWIIRHGRRPRARPPLGLPAGA